MSTSINKKTGAYFGIKNAKYCVRDADGEPGLEIMMAGKAKSLSLAPVFNKQEAYADDEIAVSVPTDKGYDGNYGCTGQDIAFETDIGQLVTLTGGKGNVEIVDLKRFDFYYEHIVKPINAIQYVVKTWLLNVEAYKPSIQHDTNAENLSIGQYQYPLKVYGEKVRMPSGEIYVDKNGFERKCFFIRSVPGDAGYANFGETVPIPEYSEIVAG